MDTQVLIVGRHSRHASGFFNPNAFPQYVRVDAERCGDRLAILAYSVETVRRESSEDQSRLLGEIRTNRAFHGFSPGPDIHCEVVYHNLSFVSGLNSTLIAVKSLLDLYARLTAKLLVPSASIFGFGKGNYGGQRVAGGRLLSWLNRSAPQSFEERDNLVAVFLRHIETWTNRAVDLRDSVIHDGIVPGLQETAVSINKPLNLIGEQDIVPPRMSDGEPVARYCENLLHSTHSLLADTLRLLPQIDVQLLSLGS